MGAAVLQCCGLTDLFQKLLEKYGQDFIKLICAEKAKMFIIQKFKEIIAKFREIISNFVAKVNAIVDGKINSFTQKFEHFKNKINNMIPGGISKLQEMKGVTINQFSGFNKIMEKIDIVRDQTLQKVEEQRVSIQAELQQKKNYIYNEIQQQRPKVPLYEKISQETRFTILRKAETEFKEQIEQNNQKMNDQISRKANSSIDQMNQNLNRINPDSYLDDIINKNFDDMVTTFAGNDLGGQINGCFDKWF